MMTELGVLVNEMSQLSIEGPKKYSQFPSNLSFACDSRVAFPFSERLLVLAVHSPWNFCDLVSSLSLIAACGCHFAANRAPEDWDHDWWEESLGVWVSTSNPPLPVMRGSLLTDCVRLQGAVGVLFKWIGVLDYMRLWSTTASHVRMIASIGTDAMPFLVVILTAIVAVALCYCIMMPGSVDFDYTDIDGGGYLKPFVTVYRMTMGDVNIKNLSEGGAFLAAFELLFVRQLYARSCS